MKRVFVGHRGVGKSSLLQRHQVYFADVKHFDLDNYIEQKEQKNISDIFTQDGEPRFRLLEQKYFFDLLSENNFVIAVGGGFDVSLIPDECEVVFVTRRTDSDGRLFLNRPRLNANESPLAEYEQRYQERELRFRARANWIYHMPEGIIDTNDTEEQLLKKEGSFGNAYYTLSSENEIEHLPCMQKFELRTDIFTPEQIHSLMEKYQQKRFLVSVRSKVNLSDLDDLKFDWALELGEPPSSAGVRIISIHEGSFLDAFRKINSYINQQYHLKFCPEVRNWDELISGYHWQQQDSKNRSFLPRTSKEDSKKSLWRWFRIIMFARQKINFVQSLIENDDQPSLYEYMQNQKARSNYFGAVLGYPVHHSRTPVTHAYSMQDHGDVLAIPLADEGNFKDVMSFLQNLGLKFAAVTSPLKMTAAQFISVEDKGINTLYYNGTDWLGISTDGDGFLQLWKEVDKSIIDSEKIVIWGGGGVTDAIRSEFPEIIEYSSRTGQIKNALDIEKAKGISPDVVIWAAPRRLETLYPSKQWHPKFIVDLNYTENSTGIEYAMQLLADKKNVEYISGLEMFYAQAEKQLHFWIDHLIKDRK